MLAMGPRDLNSAPYSPVHCSSHSMTSFQSSELTELPVVENSQLFEQRAHSEQRTVRPLVFEGGALVFENRSRKNVKAAPKSTDRNRKFSVHKGVLVSAPVVSSCRWLTTNKQKIGTCQTPHIRIFRQGQQSVGKVVPNANSWLRPTAPDNAKPKQGPKPHVNRTMCHLSSSLHQMDTVCRINGRF